MIASAGAGVAAFVSMEPFTYAAHRWVMHGVGWAWHRVHHQRGQRQRGQRGQRGQPQSGQPQPRRTPFDANDRFPVVFAAATIAAMAAGSRFRSLRMLLPIGAGVTAYGVAYAAVHDVYIHQRLGRLPAWRPMEYLAEAHAIHHRDGGEPYGMLLPVVPAARRGAPAPSRGVQERRAS